MSNCGRIRKTYMLDRLSIQLYSQHMEKLFGFWRNDKARLYSAAEYLTRWEEHRG